MSVAKKKEDFAGPFSLGILVTLTGGITTWQIISGEMNAVYVIGFLPVPAILICPLLILGGLSMILGSIFEAFQSEVGQPTTKVKSKTRDWGVSEDFFNRLNTQDRKRFLKMGKYGTKKKARKLIRNLKNRNEAVRWVSAELLGIVGDQNAIRFLRKALNDENERVRIESLLALAKLGDDEATEPLIAVLRHDGVFSRRSAAEALGDLGNRMAIVPLKIALKDGDKDVSLQSAIALAKFGEHEGIRRLGMILGGYGIYDVFHRVLAAAELGEVRDERAVESLIEALEDEDQAVRYVAAKSLERLGVIGE